MPVLQASWLLTMNKEYLSNVLAFILIGSGLVLGVMSLGGKNSNN